MANFYEDNADLRWYVEGGGIDWEPLVRWSEYDWRAPDGPENTAEAVETYKDILTAIGDFAGEAIAPLAADVDTQKLQVVDGEVVHGPALDEIFEGMADMELYGMCLPRELGGLNLPFLTYLMTIEVIARADVSVVAHYGFHGGIAMAALLYSIMEDTTSFDAEKGVITDTRFAEAIEEIRSGAAWGSMDLTESDAGSDLAKLRTRAELGEDGVWRVTGQKIYITSGHGKWHFVLARTEEAKDPDDPFGGLDALSLFLVKAYDDNEDGTRTRLTTIDGIETKLGHNGSATVAISYEDTPGMLIGERGKGFRLMLLLMNNARVGVGFESLGCCEAAYRCAVDYAVTRPSMGKTIDRHEMIADYLDEMRTDLQAIRALAMTAGYVEEMNQKLQLALKFFPPEDREAKERLEREQKRYARRSRTLTPLVKYLGSEKACEMGRRAIQIHGGAGYTKDYGAEKLLRDALVFPIYEGTSQIQALFVMKDSLLGAIRRPQAFLQAAATARWRSVSARDANERRVARLQTLSYGAQQHLMTRIAGGKFVGLRSKPMADWTKELQDWDPKRDFGPAMLHAERLLKLITDATVAEILLEQTQKDPSREDVLVRWLERAEPRSRFLHDTITSTGDRLLDWLKETAQATETEKQAAK